VGHLTGPFNSTLRPFAVDDREIDVFEHLFYRDLESWFSADIACCDHCYDEFIADWPHAYGANEAEFQKQGIDLNTFYSGSRLQLDYTRDQALEFFSQLACPRCLSPLTGNIWAYELPFCVPSSFSTNVDKIIQIAGSTPFLLMENKFCREILSAIRDLANRSKEVEIATPLYRGRDISKTQVPHEIQQFDLAPKRYVVEGRYNHAGMPVLYLASDLKTCQAELRGAKCSVMEFKLTNGIRILDLVDPYEEHRGYDDLLNCLVYSALLSAKQHNEGQSRPHYVVSRFVADCAKSTGFHAIKYPSTREADNNFNLVIVDPSFSLEKRSKEHQYHDLAGT